MVVLATVTSAAVAASPAGAAAKSCANATTRFESLTTKQMETSILCLINQERARRKLRVTKFNSKLHKASLGQAKDMVKRHYFSHVSPEGHDFTYRVKQVGYPGKRTWFAREDIAFEPTNADPTPNGIFQEWMSSAAHRANILEPRAKDAAVGVTLGTPDNTGRKGITADVLLGAH